MDRSLFDADDSTEVSRERLERAAAQLSDKQWATYCLAVGLQRLRTGAFPLWLPRLTITAALRLGRVPDVLPRYASFLKGLDSMQKSDWHVAVSRQGEHGNMLHQSGRLRETDLQFNAEYQRVVAALGAADRGLVLDAGCGGGLWAINLARCGYRVLGTEHHAFLVDAARRNAAAAGLEHSVEFRLDNICSSELPDGLCSRALCIGVTPTLADDAAFAALARHLDRITRCEGASEPRRVILGQNRWEPSRMHAVQGILNEAAQGKQSASHRFASAARRLSLLEASWWLRPRHLETLAARFTSVQILKQTQDEVDGIRYDLVLT